MHLYEEHGEDVFARAERPVRALRSSTSRRTIFLARDRVGICPLHWAQQRRLALLRLRDQGAARLRRRSRRIVDPRGLDHIFTFFAMGTRRTMFQGVQSVLPGHYLKIAFRATASAPRSTEHRYWDFDFPDAGDEDDPAERGAADRRVRGDVPAARSRSGCAPTCRSSATSRGGVDSAYVLATASTPARRADSELHHPGARQGLRRDGSRRRNRPPHRQPPDDSDAATPRSSPTPMPTSSPSADCPVPDTSCAALWCLSQEVHDQGYKVALTGEGSDEAFGGYVWFKLRGLSYWMDSVAPDGSDALDRVIRRFLRPAESCQGAQAHRRHRSALRTRRPIALSARRAARATATFSRDIKDRIGDHIALRGRAARSRAHAPLVAAQSVALLRLQGPSRGPAPELQGRPRGDGQQRRDPLPVPRRGRHRLHLAARSALEAARPARQVLLRHAAARVLPREAAFRRKAMFRAPLAETFLANAPPFVRQLMSPEALAQDRLLRSRDRRPRLRAHRLGPGRQGRRVQAAGLERRASRRSSGTISTSAAACASCPTSRRVRKSSARQPDPPADTIPSLIFYLWTVVSPRLTTSAAQGLMSDARAAFRRPLPSNRLLVARCSARLSCRPHRLARYGRLRGRPVRSDRRLGRSTSSLRDAASRRADCRDPRTARGRLMISEMRRRHELRELPRLVVPVRSWDVQSRQTRKRCGSHAVRCIAGGSLQEFRRIIRSRSNDVQHDFRAKSNTVRHGLCLRHSHRPIRLSRRQRDRSRASDAATSRITRLRSVAGVGRSFAHPGRATEATRDGNEAHGRPSATAAACSYAAAAGGSGTMACKQVGAQARCGRVRTLGHERSVRGRSGARKVATRSQCLAPALPSLTQTRSSQAPCSVRRYVLPVYRVRGEVGLLGALLFGADGSSSSGCAWQACAGAAR